MTIYEEFARLGRSAAEQGALVLDEVDQQIFPESVRRGEERTPAVDLAQSFNEVPQTLVSVEHEGVDRDASFGAPQSLGHCFLNAFSRGWVIKHGVTVGGQVCSGLAVSDHDDLLGSSLL